MTDVTEKDGVTSGLAEVVRAPARAPGMELIALKIADLSVASHRSRKRHGGTG
jgi:hypothetical protein